MLVLWGFYGFKFQARPEGLPLWADLDAYATLLKGHTMRWALTHAAHYKLLPQSYLFGLIDVMIVTAGPRMSYLFGHLYPRALWYYFPVAFVIKSTLGFLALLDPGINRHQALGGENYRKAIYLLMPPAIFMGAALTAGTNLGIRHVLPIYPFLILAAAAGAWELARKKTSWAIVVAALVLIHCGSSLRTLPNYLAYSNEAFGGTQETYRTLSESNVDWGQGLIEARQYLDRRNIKDCWFAYIGTAGHKLTTVFLVSCCPILSRRSIADVPPETYRGTVLIDATAMSGAYFGGGMLNPYEASSARGQWRNIGGNPFWFMKEILICAVPRQSITC